MSEILSKVLLSSGDIGFVWNLEKDRVQWLGEIHALLGINEQQDLAFSVINQKINPQDLPLRMKKLHDHMNNGAEYSCDYRVRLDSGRTIWFRETGFMEKDPRTAEKTFYGILRDVTLEKEQIVDLEVIAYTDTTTHLPNREGFRLILEEELDFVSNAKEEGTLFCVGIDRLNMLEEAYGTKVTEEIFTKVSDRLDTMVNKDGKVGVIAGDGFGIVLPKLGGEYRRYKAFEIIKFFADRPIMTSAGPLRVTVSVGSIGFPQNDFTAHGLMKRAEMALSQARKFGQSAYHSYNVNADKRDALRNWIVTGEQFVQSMKDNRVSLAFQKVIDYSQKDQDTIFHESLIRMIDKEGNAIPAGMFIPAVEKMGLSRLADLHSVSLTIEELKQFSDIRLSVNVSPATIMDEEWLDHVKKELYGHPDVANRLIVEITESTAMQDLPHVIEFIKVLHGLGCSVALDDFGAGQTSFSQIDKLDIDIVKIDKAFVQGMSLNEQNKLFLQAMHMLADGLGLETVAEGVESTNEADALKDEGIYNLQGFAFGKPILEREWVPEGDARRSTYPALFDMHGHKVASQYQN